MKRYLIVLLFLSSYVVGHERKCLGTSDNCDCDVVCLNTHKTICYQDFIYLKNMGKLLNNEHIIGKGNCNEKYKQECICCGEQEQSLVCGTDRQTYYNLCELRCVAETNYGKLSNLEFSNFGPCRQEDP